MAQNYTEQLRKDNVRDAIYEDLQNNCEVLRTSWSGNAFPANPKVGQPCYRVDEDKLYYWDGYKWSQKGGGGSAELKTMELAAATSERVSITLEGARCLDKNMMFVFVDKIAQDPSTYSMNDDGTVVNFNPAIPANAAVTLRWFDTDVGTFDTAIFASDAEFASGELTNKAPNVKQVHSLSDQIQTSNANYVKSELQSNLLNYTTNRILEIPQDIKLELNNGTLTLKAGSKLYVPNGPGVFKAVTMNVDAILGQSWNSNNQVFVVYTPALGTLNLRAPADCSSGSTDSLSGYFHFWYDTTNNLIKAVEASGTARAEYLSFPLALVTMTGDGTASVKSIDQVFNGFGYIGSTVFALPGVKVQAPNGKNKDGTYNSSVYTISTVFTMPIDASWGTFDIYLVRNRLGKWPNVISGSVGTRYNSENNYYEVYSTGESKWVPLPKQLAIVKIKADTTSPYKITSFEPYTVDSVVNSNEFYQLRDKAVTTDTEQTITGTKTFKGVVTAELEPINFIAKNPTMDVNKTPSSNKYVGYDFRDKNNVRIGYIGIRQGTDGKFQYEIQKPGNYVTRIVGITPSVASGGNEIVTAGWFNSKMQVVSALPANPDPNVFYFIPG